MGFMADIILKISLIAMAVSTVAYSIMTWKVVNSDPAYKRFGFNAGNLLPVGIRSFDPNCPKSLIDTFNRKCGPLLAVMAMSMIVTILASVLSNL